MRQFLLCQKSCFFAPIFGPSCGKLFQKKPKMETTPQQTPLEVSATNLQSRPRVSFWRGLWCCRSRDMFASHLCPADEVLLTRQYPKTSSSAGVWDKQGKINVWINDLQKGLERFFFRCQFLFFPRRHSLSPHQARKLSPNKFFFCRGVIQKKRR